MNLAPREVNKLILHGAGVIAQKRLARGLRLNHPEAVALIATQVCIVLGVRVSVPHTMVWNFLCNCVGIDRELTLEQVLEFIREGKSVAELMDLGKHMLGR